MPALLIVIMLVSMVMYPPLGAVAALVLWALLYTRKAG